MSFNPSATATIGLEFDAHTAGVTSLATPTTAAAFWVDSSVTETISAVYIPHTWTGPSTGYGKLAVDVYDLSDTGAGAALTDTRFQPNEDDAASNMFGTSPAWTSKSAGQVYVLFDEVSYSDTDYAIYTWTSSSRHAFNTGAMSASLQVASISFEIRAMGYYGSTPTLRVDLYDNTTFVSTLGTVSPPGQYDDTHVTMATYTLGPFTTNPLTGVAWTAADIIAMDTGSNLMIQLYCPVGYLAVSWVSMIVQTGADKRVATGTTATQTSLPSGTQTNLPVTLAAAWSKASGTDYLLVARRIDDPAGLATTLIPQPMWIGTGTNPHVHGQSYTSTLDASGLLATKGSVDTTKTYGFWLATAAGTTMSVDSQPYYNVVLQQVHTSSTLKQGVNGAAATIYKGVQLLVANPSTAPGDDLLVKVKRVSDNVQLGGTLTVTAAEITAGTLRGTLADPTLGTVSIYRLNLNLASTATLAAVDYYFEYTSAAASTAPWYAVMLDGDADHTLSGNETYGGTTNNATIAGVDDEESDFVIRISTTLDAPTSVTVTATASSITGFDYCDVDWVDAGALGATFDYWEVQRSEDGGTTYTTIATVSTEATITFADYEAPHGATLKYRVRKVRTDGAVSDWTVQGGPGTTLTSAYGVTVFVTNSDPSLIVGHAVRGTDTAYRFLSADETVFMRLHDRDYQAAFRPLETRGMSWSFEALYQGGAATPGVGAFDALRAIAEDGDVPYVCMHTADGERFFGALQVHEGRRNQPAAVYSALVTFTETQANSSQVDL